MKIIEFKHIFSYLLILSMLFTASCGDDDTEDSIMSDTDLTTVTDETTADLYSNLPTDDYGGEEFRIMNTSFTYAIYQLDTEAQNGDVLNDAIWKRTSEVEDCLNIDIKVTDEDYWSGSAFSTVRNAVLADDNSFDACCLGFFDNVSLMTSNLYIDLNAVNELDFSKPWWFSEANTYYELGGKLFTAHSDASPNLYESIWVGFFNKQIAEDEGIENIYELVNDGDWTIERVGILASQTARDLNGDSQLGNDDQWGILTHNGATFAFLRGQNERAIDIEDGIPFLNDTDENFINAVEKIRAIFENSGVMWNQKHQSEFGWNCIEGFENSRGLILFEVLGNAASLRDMDKDFGIIPFPKADEEQENYYSSYSRAANGFCIPKTAKDISRSGTVIELLSAYGYKYIRPAYYDKVLTGKTIRDNESANMLDIILENVSCEMAYNYPWGDCINAMANIMSGTSDIMSTLESSKSGIEGAIEKHLEQIQD